MKKDFIIETGRAQGLDVVLKYDYKRVYVWVVYSLTYVTRWDGIQTYHPFFDRRHNANIVASYTFGKNRNWEVDARWNIGSGFPYRPTGGWYEKLDFNSGLSTDYTSANGDMAFFFATGEKRLPWYHRLDLNIKRSFQFFENTKLEVAVGATNVYNRPNVFYVPRSNPQGRVNQLPILPTVSVNMRF